MKIDRQVDIRAPRTRVWRALTDIAEFGKWFGVEAPGGGKFVPGAKVQMKSTHPSCPGLEFYVQVEEMTAEERFSWRWHPGAVQPGVDLSNEPATLVEFTLTEIPNGTRVTVTESGFDRLSVERRAKAFSENDNGWREQLVNLERYLADAT